jgi:hypothetical protein
LRSKSHSTLASVAREETLLARSIEDSGLHVRLRHSSGSGSLLLSDGVTSLDACFELTLADILALGESNVKRLAVDHSLVHLSDSLGSFVGAREANETETLALSEEFLFGLLGVGLILIFGLVLGFFLLGFLLGFLRGFLALLLGRLLGIFLFGVGTSANSITHDLGRSDGTESAEKFAQLLIINIIREVLDVEVDTLIFGSLLKTSGLVLAAEFFLTLVFLLGTADVEFLAVEVLVVQVFDSSLGILVVDVVDETETAALSTVVTADGSRGNIAEFAKEVTELLVSNLRVDVLDVDVGEVGLHFLELALAVLLGDVVTDEHLLVVKQHTVDVLDGVVSSLGSLVVDETVSLGVTKLILSDLAAENVAKGGKGVVQSLVVDGGVQVLDEDVTLTSLAQSGVTLRPHDTAGTTLDKSVVQVLKGALAISRVVVVDVGISEGATGNSVTADSNGSNLSNGGEKLEKHSLGHRGVELANVERGRMRLVGVGSGSGIAGCGVRGNVGVDSGAVGVGSAVGVVDGGGCSSFGRHFEDFFNCSGLKKAEEIQKIDSVQDTKSNTFSGPGLQKIEARRKQDS